MFSRKPEQEVAVSQGLNTCFSSIEGIKSIVNTNSIKSNIDGGIPFIAVMKILEKNDNINRIGTGNCEAKVEIMHWLRGEGKKIGRIGYVTPADIIYDDPCFAIEDEKEYLFFGNKYKNNDIDEIQDFYVITNRMTLGKYDPDANSAIKDQFLETTYCYPQELTEENRAYIINTLTREIKEQSEGN